MPSSLTSAAFDKLLAHLDADRERAGEQYEHLRRTLIRYFEWRAAPQPAEHADAALDRVARRLTEGVEIKNLGAYCYEVARLILLETTKHPASKQAPLADHLLPPQTADDGSEAEAQALRLACLTECLKALPAENRDLIVTYYDTEQHTRIALRQQLAARLGLQREALANRAQRLRDKLQDCVFRCLHKKRAI